jgi:hypothetical protein
MMEVVDESNAREHLNRVILDGVASIISPSRELLEEERREHLYLFNLIGDPMLRLTYPQEIALQTLSSAEPGETVRVNGRTKLAGQGILELVCRRDCFKEQPPVRERFDPTDKGLAAFQGVYEQSLDRCWGRWAVELPAGDFATEITVPEGCRGPCHLRLHVTNSGTYGLGAANLYVRARPPELAAAAAATGNE